MIKPLVLLTGCMVNIWDAGVKDTDLAFIWINMVYVWLMTANLKIAFIWRLKVSGV